MRIIIVIILWLIMSNLVGDGSPHRQEIYRLLLEVVTAKKREVIIE